jgi:hypothetical protein
MMEGPLSIPTITAPDTPAANVSSSFLGNLEFVDGYPTAATLARLYDALDYQRAVQVVLRNVAAHSMHCFRAGLARDLGVDVPTTLAILRADSHSLMLTPNSETLYGTTFLRLDVDGPTVIEAPAGVLGLVDDMWMRPVEDIGPSGPDGGKGGRYLYLPPGYKGPLPDDGYFTIPTKTFGHWVLIRALLSPGGDTGPAEALLKQVRIYPLSAEDSPPAMRFVEATGKTFDTISPNDLRYFTMLAELIEAEHEDAIDQESAGTLRAIGIEKGKPFAPDARMKKILAEAARDGSFMAEALSYASREADHIKPGSQWSAGLAGYPLFTDGHRTLLDALVAMAWFATGTAKGMVTPKPGTGSQYVWTFRDAGGDWLRGEHTYTFRIPPNVPAKNFWSAVLYDNWTRAILANGQKVASKNSYDKAIRASDDGSITLTFGPKPPKEGESNWIRTVPGKGWFAIFRLYGPLEAWFKREWIPDDIQKVTA